MDAERLGQQLREARKARELTLEDVEQALRIRARFLRAFESGAYEDLPGAVQARGFLRNYARYLRLDEEHVLAQFDAVQAATTRHKPSLLPRRESQPHAVPVTVPLPDETYPVARNGQGRRLGVWLGTVVGLIVLGSLCFFAARVVERVLNAQANNEGPDLVSILPTVPSLTPSATFIPSATPAAGARVQTGATPITDRVVLNIEVVQRTYMRVVSDGTQVFDGLVRPGMQLQYQAQQALVIEASNGAGLDVVFNNIPLGDLGLRGEAVTITFTPDLVLTPTPDEAPTATFTPLPLPTSPDLSADGEPPADAALSGKAGQGEAGGPTPLPLPDQASGVTGGQTVTAVPVESSPTQQLVLSPTNPVFELPTDTPTATATFTPTTSPTPTLTLTPTAVLPPRQTSTPIPEK